MRPSLTFVALLAGMVLAAPYPQQDGLYEDLDTILAAPLPQMQANARSYSQGPRKFMTHIGPNGKLVVDGMTGTYYRPLPGGYDDLASPLDDSEPDTSENSGNDWHWTKNQL